MPLLYNNINLRNTNIKTFKSKLFLTNSIKQLKLLKNNSANDIFNSTTSQSYFKNNNNFNNSSLKNNCENFDTETRKKLFNNLILKKIVNKNNNNNQINDKINNNNENNQINKKYKIAKIKPLIHNNICVQNFKNKNLNNSLFIVNKKEKMDLNKINTILEERYNETKHNIIEKLLGKRIENKSNFE